jgi:hypothetical protein
MHPASTHAERISQGRFLFPEHVGLKGHKAAPDEKAPQFGDGGLVLCDPALLSHRQAIAAAQEVRRLLLALREERIQDGTQSITGKVGQFETCLFGDRLGGIETERRGLNRHLSSMQVQGRFKDDLKEKQLQRSEKGLACRTTAENGRLISSQRLNAFETHRDT